MKPSKDNKKDIETEISNLAKEFFAISNGDNALVVKRDTLKGKLWVAMWLYYKDVQYTGY